MFIQWALSTKDPKSLNAFFCFFFSHSKREKKNLKRENASPWAVKMNYFGIGIGSGRLSTLKLSNFPLPLSAPSVGTMVARVACALSDTSAITGLSSERVCSAKVIPPWNAGGNWCGSCHRHVVHSCCTNRRLARAGHDGPHRTWSFWAPSRSTEGTRLHALISPLWRVPRHVKKGDAVTSVMKTRRKLQTLTGFAFL